MRDRQRERESERARERAILQSHTGHCRIMDSLHRGMEAVLKIAVW